jgi:hypothetical protein
MNTPGIRDQLLTEAERFVRSASAVPGVQRIALIGSITTPKPNPKDIDLLVTVTDDADLSRLALYSRRLQGKLQGLNHWADVFLVDERGQYLGRTCGWKNCKPGIRSACDALHCGRRPHLHDDLGAVHLTPVTIATPPAQLWPTVERRATVPADVERLLVALSHAG